MAVTRTVAGSRRDTVPDCTLATHTAPSPLPTPIGPWPTFTVFHRSESPTGRGSTRVMVSVWPLTHTPSGPTMMRTAPSGSATEASRSPVLGLRRLTVPASKLATQTPPSPAARDTGSWGTASGPPTTFLVVGLMRHTSLPAPSATQTRPNPDTMEMGRPPTAMGRPMALPVEGLKCRTVPSPSSASHPPVRSKVTEDAWPRVTTVTDAGGVELEGSGGARNPVTSVAPTNRATVALTARAMVMGGRLRRRRAPGAAWRARRTSERDRSRWRRGARRRSAGARSGRTGPAAVRGGAATRSGAVATLPPPGGAGRSPS